MTESTFRFHAPFLTSLDFDLNPSYRHKEGEMVPVSIFMQTNISRTPNANGARVDVTVKLNHDNNGAKDEDAPFWIVVSYASNFSWEDGMSEEIVESLLKINAPSVLLSYIRPLVTQITSCSPYPTYNIPFLNLTKMQNIVSNE